MEEAETQTATVRPQSTAPGRAPALFLVIEGQRPRVPGAVVGLAGIERLVLGRGVARSIVRTGPDARVSIPDPKISGEHAVLEGTFGRWRISDVDSKNGTFVDGERVSRATLEPGAILQIGSCGLMLGSVPGSAGTRTLDLELADASEAGLWTLLPGLEDAYARALSVLRAGTPVAIGGPTGSGKEIVARALHERVRPGRPFVAINCGAMPVGVMESELFGHRRGAFSGSVHEHLGLLRRADGGTVFLDEVAELPAAVQVALLRVLQERTVRPVGSTEEHAVDFALLCATHRDLGELVAAGSFRADLYARVAGFTLTLPPLAERREDLALFVRSSLERLEASAAERTRLDAACVFALLRYDWPLNARELGHALANAAALAGDGRVRASDLPAPSAAPADAAELEVSPELEPLRRALVEHLQAHRGNVAAVARAMGKDRRQIHRWLQRFGIEPEDYRD